MLVVVVLYQSFARHLFGDLRVVELEDTEEALMELVAAFLRADDNVRWSILVGSSPQGVHVLRVYETGSGDVLVFFEGATHVRLIIPGGRGQHRIEELRVSRL